MNEMNKTNEMSKTNEMNEMNEMNEIKISEIVASFNAKSMY